MQKSLALLLMLVYCCSCKINPYPNRNYEASDRIYELHLKPYRGSMYYYDISNQSEISAEVNDKKSTNLNRSMTTVYYDVSKDNSGNSIVTLQYKKLHLYSKKDGDETDLDADNAPATLNPLEKMLGGLKEAKMSAVVSPKGEVISMSGYKELGDKIFTQISFTDENTRNLAREEWDKTIGNGMVKDNMDQIFRIFPDSAVHIGDTWKINNGRSGLSFKNIYKLKAINDDLAIIESTGVIDSDSSLMTVAGLGNIPNELNGEQTGEYEIETKTGMLVSAKSKARVRGSITVGGNEVPLDIEMSVKINGRKVK